MTLLELRHNGSPLSYTVQHTKCKGIYNPDIDTRQLLLGVRAHALEFNPLGPVLH